MGIGRLERLNVRVACLAPGQNSTARGLAGLSKQKTGHDEEIGEVFVFGIVWLYYDCILLYLLCPGKNHQGLTALSKHKPRQVKTNLDKNTNHTTERPQILISNQQRSSEKVTERKIPRKK